MDAIFISYRREGGGIASDMLYEELMRRFPGCKIFKDIHDIRAGAKWEEVILDAIKRTRVLVAVISPQWGASFVKREQHAEADWMRFELETALAMEGVSVVPIYVDGADEGELEKMPASLDSMRDRLRESQSFVFNTRAKLNDELRRFIEELERAHEWLHGKLPARRLADPSLVRGRRALVIVVLTWIGLMCWREWAPAGPIDKVALNHLLFDNCWVTYDPSGKTLDASRHPVYPGELEMRKDLEVIKSAGFSGVLTTSSHLEMTCIPKLARETGLRVIMGVWHPADRAELERAIRQAENVDAYCVGDVQAQQGLQVEDLIRTVILIKKRTGRPAAVSDLVERYGERLASAGDWLFPDAHLTLSDAPGLSPRSDVARDIALFMDLTKSLAARSQASDRPLLFKNVAYPHDGCSGASEDMQREFYHQLLANLNDAQRGHSVRASFVAQGAFDAPWKVGVPFLRWDPCTGLLDWDPSSGRIRPRPAVAEILRWYPHLVPASSAP